MIQERTESAATEGRGGTPPERLSAQRRVEVVLRLLRGPKSRRRSGDSNRRENAERPVLAFLDYPDVFEDFYPHYGVTQQEFATRWSDTGNHAFVRLLQRDIGDVVWYCLSLKPDLEKAHHETTGCTVRLLRSSWLHRTLWALFYLPKCAWRWRFAYRAYATVASYAAPLSVPFVRAIIRDRPDVFFLQDYCSGRFDVVFLLSRLFGIPLVAYHSGSQPGGYLGRTIRSWTMRRADFLIASGQREFEMLATRFGVPRGRLRVILTPIDTELYQPERRAVACAALGLDDTRGYFLFIGRLADEVKRVSAIIRAFATLAPQRLQFDLLIAGNGRDEQMLRALSEELAPGRIHFLGWVSDLDRKKHLYNAADCLVLASWREGLPTVVGEAMACGTPVLSSDVGSVNELVVEGRTGWLFQAGDDEAMQGKMEAVMERPEEVKAMRPAVRGLALNRVSPDAVGAALRECIAAC